MINILLIGCLGRLGLEISKYVNKLSGYKIVAGIDKNQDVNNILDYNVYSEIQNVIDNNIIADVVIDFSHPSALKSTLDICKQLASPLVLGTTGIDDNQILEIKKTGEKIPVFWSVNMAFGISILTNVCEQIIAQSDNIFDIDIIEQHHNKKKDAPSGTANMIASMIKKKSDTVYNTNKKIITNNYKLDFKRDKEEIRVYSLRAGNITGKHTVLFNHGDETLTISHISSSKEVFAKGTIKAVDFILKKKPGLYQRID